MEPHDVTLRDGRVVHLREPVVEDAERVLAYLDGLRHEAPYILFSPDDPLPTLEEERDFLKARMRDDAFRVLAEHDGQVISLSNIGARSRSKTRHVADIGIGIRKAYQGVGLGRLMMQQLLAFARHHPQILKVELECFTANANAIRLYERMGFTHEGVSRNHIRQPDGTFHDEARMGLWVGEQP